MVPSPAGLLTSASVATTVEEVLAMEVAITALPPVLTRLMVVPQDPTTTLTVTATTHPTPTPTPSKFPLPCRALGSRSQACRCSQPDSCYLVPSRLTRLRRRHLNLVRDRAKNKDSD